MEKRMKELSKIFCKIVSARLDRIFRANNSILCYSKIEQREFILSLTVHECQTCACKEFEIVCDKAVDQFARDLSNFYGEILHFLQNQRNRLTRHANMADSRSFFP
jgi:hypothetical protein